MMKINRPAKLSKKALVISGAIILVALGSYGVYATTSHSWLFSSSSEQVPSSDKTDSTDKAGSDPKPSVTPSDLSPSDATSPKTPKESEPTATPAPQDSVGVTITSVHNSAGTLQIRTLIENVSSDGSCTLTFEKGGTVITKSSDIQALPSSSTCKGFNVPVSELSLGTWHLTLKVTAGSKTGSTTKDYKVTS